MGDDEATHAVTTIEAARLSALFAACVGVVTFVTTLAITAGDDAGAALPAIQLTQLFLFWPLWAVLISGVALFGLTTNRYLFTRWDFAWRGAFSCYIGIATASCGAWLIVALGPNPGYGGGFIWVFVSLVGFTIIGGPLVAGFLAALLMPRRFRRIRTR
jgi:hypothetical protein